MCLLNDNPQSPRGPVASRLLCLFLVLLGLFGAAGTVALHVRLASGAMDFVDFLRGLLLGLALTVAVFAAWLARRGRRNGASASR